MSVGDWLRGRLRSMPDGGWVPLPDDLEARLPGRTERFALLTFDPDDPGSRLNVLGSSDVALSTLGRALMRRVIDAGSVQVFDDLAADPDLREAAAEQGARAAVGFPIEVRGRVVGVASLFLDRPGVEDEALARLRGFSGVVAGPLEVPVTPPAPAPPPTPIVTPPPPSNQGLTLMPARACSTSSRPSSARRSAGSTPSSTAPRR